jgi:hypothetical protein
MVIKPILQKAFLKKPPDRVKKTLGLLSLIRKNCPKPGIIRRKQANWSTSDASVRICNKDALFCLKNG